MMNVYEHIAENNRKIALTLCVFPVALFATVYLFAFLGINIGLVWILEAFFYGEAKGFGFFDRLAVAGSLRQAWRLTLGIYPWVVSVTFTWIVISYFIGDAMILRSARAHSVTFEENRELFRLVENTAIMAGLPTPKIYFIDVESLNAFATGCRPGSASIALTRGLVEKLDESELQAVIAHELAHIGNRDTRLMAIVIAGIGFFTFIGEKLSYIVLGSCASRMPDNTRQCEKEATGHALARFYLIIPAIVVLFLSIVCLVFGYTVAPIIRFALSRRQEYQADATAAKIIRNPDALMRALIKIAPDSKIAAIDRCPLVGNVCIADPTRTVGLENKLFETHPPIEERIAALKNMMGKDNALQNRVPMGRVIGHMD